MNSENTLLFYYNELYVCRLVQKILDSFRFSGDAHSQASSAQGVGGKGEKRELDARCNIRPMIYAADLPACWAGALVRGAEALKDEASGQPN
jgi:hypothetical protein